MAIKQPVGLLSWVCKVNNRSIRNVIFRWQSNAAYTVWNVSTIKNKENQLLFSEHSTEFHDNKKKIMVWHGKIVAFMGNYLSFGHLSVTTKHQRFHTYFTINEANEFFYKYSVASDSLLDISVIADHPSNR